MRDQRKNTFKLRFSQLFDPIRSHHELSVIFKNLASFADEILLLLIKNLLLFFVLCPFRTVQVTSHLARLAHHLKSPFEPVFLLLRCYLRFHRNHFETFLARVNVRMKGLFIFVFFLNVGDILIKLFFLEVQINLFVQPLIEIYIFFQIFKVLVVFHIILRTVLFFSLSC